jgi:hypothetical protein
MVDGWNHPAFFDYIDRWWEEERQANDFVKSMWQRYRQKADEIGANVRDAAKTSIPSTETGKMDTLEAIRTRRSIRQYLDKPVPQDVLRQVLASASTRPVPAISSPGSATRPSRGAINTASRGSSDSKVDAMPRCGRMTASGV